MNESEAIPGREDEWVRRAQAGDQAAFTQLVLAHQRFVYNLALRGVGDPQEAEDVAQEAFVRAWLGLPRFRRKAQFRTWLYRIVMNLCYTRLPRLRRELAMPAMEEEDQGGGDPPLTSEDNPQDEVLSAERKAILQREVDRLPEAHRLLITLRYQMDLAYNEIAEVLEMPVGTVKTGLHRAHRQLRRAMQQYEEAVL